MTTTQDRTGDQMMPVGAPEIHEHGWSVESRHATSQGWVLYVRCAGCGARRVDVLTTGMVPEPYSAVVLTRSRV